MDRFAARPEKLSPYPAAYQYPSLFLPLLPIPTPTRIGSTSPVQTRCHWLKNDSWRSASLQWRQSLTHFHCCENYDWHPSTQRQYWSILVTRAMLSYGLWASRIKYHAPTGTGGQFVCLLLTQTTQSWNRLKFSSPQYYSSGNWVDWKRAAWLEHEEQLPLSASPPHHAPCLIPVIGLYVFGDVWNLTSC